MHPTTLSITITPIPCNATPIIQEPILDHHKKQLHSLHSPQYFSSNLETNSLSSYFPCFEHPVLLEIVFPYPCLYSDAHLDPSDPHPRYGEPERSSFT